MKDDAIHSLAPDEAAAVNSGQPLPDKFKQDAAAKGRLTAYYQKMFHGYLKVGQYDLADSQLKRLSGRLGVSQRRTNRSSSTTADLSPKKDRARLM